MVEFFANPANSVTYRNEITAAQAAGLQTLTPGGIRRLFKQKKIQAAIQAYAEQHGIVAPVKTADDAESERQDKLLDEMIGLNILDVMEQVEIARVDDLGNIYYERQLQMKPFSEIHHLGRFMKGIDVDPKKFGQKLKIDFHDKLAAKRLRDTIKKRIGTEGGAGAQAPTVNIIIPSLGGQQQPVKIVSQEGQDSAESPDAEA